ncbi:hypothetical protein [Burkholderia sp. LMU1-1-1.1]|uniref:hypothetical protein n=1 Tax=Burkholderia sp. LMU1-1-1.1 TaxID=3135266 RepID=UPI00342AB455
MRFVNFMRIVYGALIVPIMQGIALCIFLLKAVDMLGAGSVTGALRQLLIVDNLAGGVMLGLVFGLINAVRVGGTLPTHEDIEPDFSNSGLGKDRVELFNPATGLPLVNPEAGSVGGVDIHNNSYGGSQNEW